MFTSVIQAKHGLELTNDIKLFSLLLYLYETTSYIFLLLSTLTISGYPIAWEDGPKATHR